jgi:hypothetical protein
MLTAVGVAAADRVVDPAVDLAADHAACRADRQAGVPRTEEASDTRRPDPRVTDPALETGPQIGRPDPAVEIRRRTRRIELGTRLRTRRIELGTRLRTRRIGLGTRLRTRRIEPARQTRDIQPRVDPQTAPRIDPHIDPRIGPRPVMALHTSITSIIRISDIIIGRAHAGTTIGIVRSTI